MVQNLMNKILTKNRIWLIRIVLFFCLLIPLLMVNNEFHMDDEYRFAISLDQGLRIFSFHHLLSNISAYIVWFLATILAFKVSAYRALQVTSSIMASIGAVALIDLGIFWGLRIRNAVLFSLPVILSNAFVRYGTSAYPDASAMGLGLVAANLIIRAVAKQNDSAENTISFKSFCISGLIAGFASLLHLVFLTIVPGLIFGIIINLRKLKHSLRIILLCCTSCVFGLLAVLGVGYTSFFLLIIKAMPEQSPGVESRMLDTLVASKERWVPNFPDFFTGLKTFGALFIPGFHSSNSMLDLIYDLPRVLAILIIGWLLINAWKTIKNKPEVPSWLIPMLLSILTLFFTLLFTNFWFSRQYATIGLAAFGPLFLALGILTIGNKSFLSRFSFIIISGAFLFYMIFGIEGVIEITLHDSSRLRKHVEKCDILKPKSVHFPWNTDGSSLNPECCYARDTLG